MLNILNIGTPTIPVIHTRSELWKTSKNRGKVHGACFREMFNMSCGDKDQRREYPVALRLDAHAVLDFTKRVGRHIPVDAHWSA